MAEDLGGSYFGARWSAQLARPPAWLQQESNAVIDWYKRTVFDRTDVDANDILAGMEAQYRQDAARHGLATDQTSSKVLAVIGEMAVGELSWADAIALSTAPNNPLEAQGDRYVAPTIHASVDEIVQGSLARVGPPPTPGADAYGTLTGPGAAAATASAAPSYAAPLSASPAFVPTSSAAFAPASSLNPYLLAAGAVLLWLAYKGKL